MCTIGFFLYSSNQYRTQQAFQLPASWIFAVQGVLKKLVWHWGVADVIYSLSQPYCILSLSLSLSSFPAACSHKRLCGSSLPRRNLDCFITRNKRAPRTENNQKHRRSSFTLQIPSSILPTAASRLILADASQNGLAGL